MNATSELLTILRPLSLNNVHVKCAEIETNPNKSNLKNVASKNVPKLKILLKEKHSIDDFEDVLAKLDFEYDAGIGTQYIFGTIWLDDNSHIVRKEYDGSEKWEHIIIPEIPEYLK